MSLIEPYNEEVRARFAKPVHAGELDSGYPAVIVGAAGEPATGASIAIAAGIEDEAVRILRFRAWGCPHFVSAADLACSLGEGGKVTGLADITASRLMERLAVPRAKAGRIFVIEDALRSIVKQFEDNR
jgi:NifU-like protein involved in Fe-S cluster formation